MVLHLDFETRSRIDLRSRGVYVYAEDPSTEILMAGIAVDDNAVQMWYNEIIGVRGEMRLSTLIDALNNAQVIYAHNAAFERTLCQKLIPMGLNPDVPRPSRWRCTAAMSRAAGLPGDLKRAAIRLNLPTQKDKQGHLLMMKLCKPDKTGNFRGTPEEFQREGEYCRQDVEVERALGKAIRPLSDEEQALWELDQRINDAGIPLDMGGIYKLSKLVEVAQVMGDARLTELTEGRVTSAFQLQRMIDELDADGVETEDLTKASVNTLLKTATGKSKEILKLRKQLGRSALKKLGSMSKLACRDGRVRGAFLYHGAAPGRWSGKGIQPQNFVRDSFKDEADVERILANGSDDIMTDASRCLRGMIYSPKGLCAVDFSSIEARVLAWMADEQTALEVFRKGLDPYKVAAAPIYAVAYDIVTKGQRMIGKVCELSLGYQGWLGAFHSMAKNYGVTLSDDEATKVIKRWRGNRPKTVQLWADMETASRSAMTTPVTWFPVGKCAFGYDPSVNVLYCRLPSGRRIYYREPRYVMAETPYGGMKEVLAYIGLKNNKVQEVSVYGGKLTENADQAISRDCLAYAMRNLDAVGCKLVMHVHDEPVLEGRYPLADLEKLMSITPPWAEGLLLAAAGWTGTRYKKD